MGVLLHQPSVAEMRRGVLFLDVKRLLEAAERLLPRFRRTLCERLHLNLSTRTSWPSRSLENMVAAEVQATQETPNREPRHAALRGVGAEPKRAPYLPAPLPARGGPQLYLSGVFARDPRARLEIDGKTRHKNIEACFHVARKKRRTDGPASPVPGSPASTASTGLGRTASREVCGPDGVHRKPRGGLDLADVGRSALDPRLPDPLVFFGVGAAELVHADAVVKGGQHLHDPEVLCPGDNLAKLLLAADEGVEKRATNSPTSVNSPHRTASWSGVTSALRLM